MAEGGLSINRSQESIDARSLDHDSTLQVPYTLSILVFDFPFSSLLSKSSFKIFLLILQLLFSFIHIYNLRQ